ncbi:helix-turn-helix transcriptional regulator [Salmonella enterica subsp. enterica serovar Weltevreden]|jgi:transcriptional regulator with XRE-family HTH domain|uniref:helix-turn-helix domain-containing protein n=1 Tax=Enterobacter cloacae TaxID=550 RepID=UPI001DDF3842|nr:XRE family transcriptional regulator [Salmonella enterica]EDK2434966.1 XRE family transcriptional regulator [Salmonella enterica subsp. enterica serovar Derby]EDS4819849.1 helix-turn-helix transcriptional regulator [Salmonella enterica subsp. enterica serovar Weltevreden]EDV8887924.1 helix-turn-helix transcriptional regulator [Salmonella enterica subsp. enterica serovar Weltevreden]ELD2411502.1 helix-turn-helix transcriptional regulator [Salmonella enterica]
MKRDDRYDKLQKLLISHRKKLGITQKTLSEALGKPQSYISKYETGERRIDVIELIDICDELGVPFYNLIREVTKK